MGVFGSRRRSAHERMGRGRGFHCLAERPLVCRPAWRLLMVGPRALQAFLARRTPVSNYYARLDQLAAGDAGL